MGGCVEGVAQGVETLLVAELEELAPQGSVLGKELFDLFRVEVLVEGRALVLAEEEIPPVEDLVAGLVDLFQQGDLLLGHGLCLLCPRPVSLILLV